MRRYILKLFIVGLFATLFAHYALTGSPARANRSGPIPSVSGAPGESTCAACHGGGPASGTLAITGLPATYAPNQEVNITVTLTQSNRNAYGFQLTAIDDSGRRAGDLTPNDNRTQTQTNPVSGNQRQYIDHTFAGTSPFTTGVGSWTFRWRAPAQSAGRITFYAAGNAANGNGTTSGDSIYTTNASIQPAPTLSLVTSVSAASFAPNGILSSDAIAAAFGAGLAQSIVHASSVPLPTELGGTEVRVRDALGVERNAGLFFVAPGQVNYLIPTGTINGTATVTVRRDGTDVAQGTLPIETVSPGLFSANANGQGVPAAVILRRRGTVDTFEQIAQLNPTTGRFEAIPIDLGPEGDLVVLLRYGTAIRGRSSESAVSCMIGGTPAQVLFTGPDPVFVGVDQSNILLPRSLIGRGNVNIEFQVDNKSANILSIIIR